MTSIFSRIFRYRQSEGRTPREDYFTETFADVLCKSKLFKKVFLMWLFDELELENIRSIRLETQKRFGNLRPDIFVKVGDTDNMSCVAIIESKIDSCLGEGQLEAYDGILSNYWPNAQSRILVYITKHNEDIGDYQAPDDVIFRQCRWSNLYKKFVEAKQERPEEVGALEHELLKFMEDWQMNGGIKPAHLRSLITCVNTGVGERLTEIQDQAWHDSGLNDVWINTQTQGNWNYSEKWQGGQYSNRNLDYGVRIWMGFRYDRRDTGWNVDDREIPCPAVSLARVDDANNMFPQPENWTNPDGIEFFDGELWVRQPTQEEIQGIPNYGEPLDDYYSTFFMTAFTEFIAATNMIP